MVNADRTETADVLIENGVITDLSYDLQVPPGARVISAEGLLVIPGGIDPHTHLEFEFMGSRSADDFLMGTRAAVAGGTTMVMDFAIAKPGQSLLEIYDKYRKMADGRVCCDYGLHIGLTYWSDTVPKEMETLCAQHGINSFKLFMAYKDVFMVDDGELYEAFKRCRELGAIAMVHAENGYVIEKNALKLKAAGITGPEGHELSRPEDLETEATNRAAMIAGQVDAPLYVVHVMSESAAKVIADRRAEGQTNLYGEILAAALGTAPPKHHCEFHMVAGHVMSPPIRSDPNNPICLMNRLATNGLQVTASDNCTFNKEQKALGKGDFTKIPSGVNGLEDRMSLIWDRGVAKRIIDAQKFVEITSTNAAKIFNFYPKKGCIAVGSDADIVIWNPNKSRTISAKTHNHACDFNIFEGMTVTGVADTVIVKGKICYENGKVKEIPGLGAYVSRPVFSPHVYARRNQKQGTGDYACDPACNVLSYEERQLMVAALKKAAATNHQNFLKLFKELDPRGEGRVKKSDFNKVLQNLGFRKDLSEQEFEALVKSLARHTPPSEYDVDYQLFLANASKASKSS